MNKNKLKLVMIIIMTCFLFIAVYYGTKYFYKDDNIIENHIRFDDIIIFSEPNGIIQINIDTYGNNLPISKNDGDLPVDLEFKVGNGGVLNTYGKIKVQGTSTSKWPKKNWTLKFYADEERTDELKIKIGDSIASNKWIVKADWIDPSFMRNSVSYKLWESIVESRKTYPMYEVDNAWINENNVYYGTQSAAQGYPKTYPVQVLVNDEHYGISLLILGHDPKNFNIDKDNPNHVYMEFDARGGYTDVKTWDKFSSEGIDEWIDGYYPKNEDFTDEQKASIDVLGDFINGSQENFNENFFKHIDKANMIDMLLFMEAIYDYDAVAQDIEMVTYDLEKWYFLPWDKDTTFGILWNEEGIIPDSEKVLLFDYFSENEEQKPWYKTYHAFTPEVEGRYRELRDKDVFTVNNIYRIASDINRRIPEEVWQAERDRWDGEGRPSLDETSTAQILSWFEKRLELLDTHFNYK